MTIITGGAVQQVPGPDTTGYEVRPWAANEDVKAGIIRYQTMSDTTLVFMIATSAHTTAATLTLAELGKWTYLRQDYVRGFPATSNVIKGYQISVNNIYYQSDSTRLTPATFDAAEELVWQGSSIKPTVVSMDTVPTLNSGNAVESKGIFAAFTQLKTDISTILGVPLADGDMGTYASTIIPPDEAIKANLTALSDYVQSNRSVKPWITTVAYGVGDVVLAGGASGVLVTPNGPIAANTTSFIWGTTGATWRPLDVANGMNWLGPWVSGGTFNSGDLVSFGGWKLYYALNVTNGTITPSTAGSGWSPLDQIAHPPMVGASALNDGGSGIVTQPIAGQQNAPYLGSASYATNIRIDDTGTIAAINNKSATGNITIGSTITSGVMTIGGAAQTGDLSIQTGTGNIAVGTNAVAKTITIGNITGATTIGIENGSGTLTLSGGIGTGPINIGNSATAKTVTVGNTVGASTLNLASGSGGTNLTFSATGSLKINGSAGTAGQVPTSQGPSLPPIWGNGGITADTIQALTATGTATAWGSLITMTSATAATVTLPRANASDIGKTITAKSLGAGTTTIAPNATLPDVINGSTAITQGTAITYEVTAAGVIHAVADILGVSTTELATFQSMRSGADSGTLLYFVTPAAGTSSTVAKAIGQRLQFAPGNSQIFTGVTVGTNIVTVTNAGRYKVSAMASIDRGSAAADDLTLEMTINGVITHFNSTTNNAGNHNEFIATSGLVNLNANDIIDWRFGAGTTQNINVYSQTVAIEQQPTLTVVNPANVPVNALHSLYLSADIATASSVTTVAATEYSTAQPTTARVIFTAANQTVNSGGFTVNAAAGTITALVAGSYVIDASCGQQIITTSNQFGFGIYRNGTIIGGARTAGDTGGSTGRVSTTAQVTLAVNDVIDFRLFQNGQTSVVQIGYAITLTPYAAQSVIQPGAITVTDNTASQFFDIGNMRTQWGSFTTTGAAVTITLPAPFLNNNYRVNQTVNGNFAANQMWSHANVSKTTNNFSAFTVQMNTGSATLIAASGQVVDWIAVGQRP